MPTYRFDMPSFVKDVEAQRVKRNATQRTMGAECGVAATTIGNMLHGRKSEIDVVLSVCAWLKRDISEYIVEGLPHGVQERWTATHPDGRTATVEHGATYAKFTMRGTDGKQLKAGNRRYGKGMLGYDKFITELIDQGFVETGRLTS